MGNGPVEPDANRRVLARELRQMYVALTLEEFTADEALRIIGYMLAIGSSKE